MSTASSEGLRIARLMMVLSGFSPLFILWGVRGLKPVPTGWLIVACFLLVVMPNAILLLRWWIARRDNDRKMLSIGEADDNRDHLLVYLFAMVLPLYDLNVEEPREACAMALALGFIIFLFWHLDLHYMNIAFAIFGYRVFTVWPSKDGSNISDRRPFIVLTRRCTLQEGEKLNAVRISNYVFWDTER